MSILVRNSSLISRDLLELPKGNFNPTKQTWDFEEEKVTNHIDFTVYMGTGTVYTYSATTQGGKDQGIDDQGS